MVVGLTTTYVISSYHHWCCEFESRSGRGVQHYVIKFVCDLRQVGGILRVLRFPPPINWPPQYNWNIGESGLKHHQANKQHLTINVPNECSPQEWNVLGSTTITLNQTLKLICAASLLITQHYRVRKVPDWLEIRSNKS